MSNIKNFRKKKRLWSLLKDWYAKKYLKTPVVSGLLEPDIRVYWFVAASIFVSLIFYAIVFMLSENSPYRFDPMLVPDVLPGFYRSDF